MSTSALKSSEFSNRVVVEFKMSVEDARKVIYQGKRAPHEPMGKLLDSNQIDLIDLAWGAQNGIEAPFREASRTLLANYIGHPETLKKVQRYGPEVLEGSHFLQENEDESLMRLGIFFGVVATTVLWVLFESLRWLLTDGQQQIAKGAWVTISLGVVLNVLLIVGGSWYIYRTIKKEIATYRSFRTGREGEDKAIEELRMSLDNRWTIFHNLHLPGHDKDDVDIILVGPAGVWATEVKASRGTLRARNSRWEIQTKNGWMQVPKDPSAQVKKDAVQLRDFLQREGIDIRWVEPAVILVEKQPVENFKDSDIRVWFLPTINEQCADLQANKPPNEKELQKIVMALRKLAEEQKVAENAKK